MFSMKSVLIKTYPDVYSKKTVIWYNQNMNILEIKDLSLGFDTEDGFKEALWNVSLNLEQGKTLALVGESGCGKTISAMSILQLLPKTAKITSGSIIYDGKNLLEYTSKEMQTIRGKEIALIPQDPMTSLNPLYTVGEQLLEVIRIHQGINGKEAWTKAKEAFDEVQIPSAEERLKSYPHEFSGGMKQRAIIAMALACKAKVLIADEPTTALDVTIQAQIMNLMRQIKQDRNTAILMITHDLALVKENADNVCVMYSGRIAESASAEIFFKNPVHPYSVALLNSIPSGRGRNLETIKGQPPTINQIITGCRFHPRCKNAFEPCNESVPALERVEDGHNCACHYVNNTK